MFTYMYVTHVSSGYECMPSYSFDQIMHPNLTHVFGSDRFIRYRRVHHTVYMVFRLGRANLVSLLSLEPWGSLLELSSTQTTHQSLLTQMLQQSTRTLSRIRQVAPMCTPSNTWFLGFTRV